LKPFNTPGKEGFVLDPGIGGSLPNILIALALLQFLVCVLFKIGLVHPDNFI
jgi:hypothetical protein